MNFEDNTTFTQSENIVSCEFEGGSALLDLEKSQYYKLNISAAMVWEWLGAPITLAGLSKCMMQHFDVEESVCLSDIKIILRSFSESGLIENVNDTSA